MTAGAADPANLYFTRDQMRSVDRTAIAEYAIPGVVLMENASRTLLEACLRLRSAIADPSDEILILAGPGNNGGDGFALARHLHNRGLNPIILLAGTAWKGDAEINRVITENMALETHSLDTIPSLAAVCPKPAVIVDALFGTGLDRPIEGPIAQLIRDANALRNERGDLCRMLAVDIPSGLDCDTGRPVGDADVVIKADETCTLAGRMIGFTNPESHAFLGDVTVGDIGAPRELLTRFGEAH